MQLPSLIVWELRASLEQRVLNESSSGGVLSPLLINVLSTHRWTELGSK